MTVERCPPSAWNCVRHRVEYAAQERLASIAKEYKISQTDVVLTLMENTDLEAMAPKFKAKREDKVKSRGSKSAVLERLKNLSPEQLEKLLASL